MDPLTLFQEAIRHYKVDLKRVCLFTTASPASIRQEVALIYVGPDLPGRQAVAEFQSWLFPWLGERREDIAGLVVASDVMRAYQQVRAFAGPTEVLRTLGALGSLKWAIALHMVGKLTAGYQSQYADAYVEGGSEMMRKVLGITAHPELLIPNTPGPQQPPVTYNLLVKGISIGEPFRGLLMGLEPAEQLQLLEQIVKEVETFEINLFAPLTTGSQGSRSVA
jgi:hypothetical protein